MVNSCLPASGPSNAIIHLEIQIVGEEINCPSEYLSITVDFAVSSKYQNIFSISSIMFFI